MGCPSGSSVKSQMNWFRTIRGFVRLLIALFVVAQFAGVVSSPRANAQPMASAAAAHDHHQHGSDHADAAKHHHHGGGSENLADTCCALHAYFAGVLPQAVLIETESVIGESLAVGPDDQRRGVPPGRLDRPPRPLR
jgi:Ni/Co efflux regulator RcnB